MFGEIGGRPPTRGPVQNARSRRQPWPTACGRRRSRHAQCMKPASNRDKFTREENAMRKTLILSALLLGSALSPAYAGSGPIKIVLPEEADRKSTRLNSSH